LGRTPKIFWDFSRKAPAGCGNLLCDAAKPSIMSDPPGNVDDRAACVAAALTAHGRWLRTVLAARGVEHGMLDEAFQDVASEALRGAARLQDPSKAAPWLYRIAVTHALVHRRRMGRRRKLVERFADSGLAPSEALDADPLAWLLAEEEQQLVRKAIAALPRRDAELLLLKYTEDWSYRDLAERLGVSTSSIEARLYRARGRLRATLARLAPELTNQRL
jgi:RNA polymerase sigma-70 factor (ECF subfamily)